MTKKIKHPTNKHERRVIEKKKKLHSNASPVAQLLNEREIIHASRTDNRELHPRRDLDGPVGGELPPPLRPVEGYRGSDQTGNDSS